MIKVLKYGKYIFTVFYIIVSASIVTMNQIIIFTTITELQA